MNPSHLAGAVNSGDLNTVILICLAAVLLLLMSAIGYLVKGWMRRIDGNISRLHVRFDDLANKHLPMTYVNKDTCKAHRATNAGVRGGA